jgi:hypothetical protein
MLKRSFLCLAGVLIFWAIGWPIGAKLARYDGVVPFTTYVVVCLVGGTWLLTLPGASFGWRALRSGPRKGWAAVAFALNLVIFLLPLGLAAAGGYQSSTSNQEVLFKSLIAGAAILAGVVGLTLAVRERSPGYALLRAVLVTAGLATALGFGVALVLAWAYPVYATPFPVWWAVLLFTFFTGAAGLVVGLLGGFLIACFKLAGK